jgi:septal ring factor EnvC (AmiA/AmiB activator)
MPLPTNDSLAKEEIAKLDDIHQQLQDQRYELKQQHNDIDTLLKLKEDQIKLMEAKIAAQDKP